ncbi:MAG: C4-type zinc ribbon domain-containing protein [Myxococcota bacterium]
MDLIPRRLEELDADLGKLEEMLAAERTKCEETRAFQRSQEGQLAEEEELIRNAKARSAQVKTARELNAAQREVESTRRMAAARSEEISKLKQGVEETEQRIATMDEGLSSLRTQADAEKARLIVKRDKTAAKLEKLKTGRSELTDKIDPATLRTYERIRKRVGGVAFVAVQEQRCTACKMVVPHLQFVTLKKGQEILTCESCGRLLYWAGHFPDEKEEKRDEPAPKAAPPKVRKA